MPSIVQLNYVLAVARHGHFGRAADECCVTQPTLSAQVAKVEEDVGFSLFDRSQKPIVPTARGVAFLAQARVVDREYRRLLELARREGHRLVGELRVGIIPTVAPYLMPLFLDAFSSAFPDVQLSIDEFKTSELVRDLRAGRVDAGIMATPLEEADLEDRVLYYEGFSLYVAKDHPLSTRRRISARDLDAGEMWLLADGHCFRHQVENYCAAPAARKSLSNVSFEGGTIDTLRQLIRRGRGYTLVPELFVRSLTAVERASHVRDLESPRPTRRISLVSPKGHWKQDLIAALARAITDGVPPEMLKTDARRQNLLGVGP